MKESQQQREQLYKALRRNVLSALEELGQGFLDDLRSRPAELKGRRGPNAPPAFIASEELLAEIYQESLCLLYRLLFIFYAESRDLLGPRSRAHSGLDKEAGHDPLALESIRDEIIARQDAGDQRQPFSKAETVLWERLSALFRRVNPRTRRGDALYQGGLFDPRSHRFLERFKVSDHHLARAIDLLGRTRAAGSKRRGGVLEKRCGRLLEKIDYSALDVRCLGSIYEDLLEYRAAVAGHLPDLKSSGQYHLLRCGRESKRKTSGSYYTPDHIVRYMVESSLGPLVRGDGRARPLTSDEILELKVLDPAMGTGHFLLAATEYLARACRDARLRESESSEARGEAGSLAGDGPGSADELAHFSRLVAERCIYGVDLDPMAVELAKLSLRLLTMERGRPLTFLNHHLKAGDALVGASIKDLYGPTATDTENRFETGFGEKWPLVLRRHARITKRETLAPRDVRLKHRLEREAAELKGPFQRSADAFVRSRFGLRAGDRDSPLSRTETERASASETLRPFHWELEFPEIFYDPRGRELEQGGFDAVIGNPPYLSFGLRGVGKLDALRRAYLSSSYPDSSQYKISLYALFVERGLALLRGEGLCSFVLPDSFLLGKHFRHLRQRVLRRGQSVRGLTMLGAGFWDGAQAGRPVILLAGRSRSASIDITFARDAASLLSGERAYRYRLPSSTYEQTPLSRFYLFLSKDELAFYRRITKHAPALSGLVKFYSGLIGRAGQKNIVFDRRPDAESVCAASKLIESGRLLRPYRVEWNGKYIAHDPALYKSGYSPHLYQAPKLFLNQTGDHFKACVDERGFYCLNNMHIGYPLNGRAALYLAAGILNSEPGRLFYKLISMEGGRALAQIDIDVLDLFPLPKGSDDLSAITHAMTLPLAPPGDHLSPVQRIVLLSRILHGDARRRGSARDYERLEGLMNESVLDAYEIDRAMLRRVAARVCEPFANENRRP